MNCAQTDKDGVHITFIPDSMKVFSSSVEFRIKANGSSDLLSGLRKITLLLPA